MTEENTESTESAIESEQKEQTLDDIYKEFNVETEAQQFEAKPETAPMEPLNIPDPLDTDAYRNYEQQTNAAFMKELSDVKAKLTEFQQQQQHAQISKDIQQAVDILSSKVEGVNPKALEYSLEAKAAEDPKFKSLWDNRHKNPDAWNKALDIYSRDVGEIFSVKQDPQLMENQRAVAQSQRSMATTSNTEPNEQWDGLDNDQFDHEWRGLINN